MTPDERRAQELEYLDEYEEQMRCLGALDQKIRDLGGRLQVLGTAFADGTIVTLTTEGAAELASIPQRLDDYRTTWKRCTTLYAFLTDQGQHTMIRGVGFSER